MALIPIVVLIGIISILIVYNVNIKKKLTTFNNVTSKINKLNALQDFMNITGEDLPVDEKIQKINSVLIEKFEIKYSSIVVFNGAEYVLKASNTDQKYWNNLTNLHTEDVFKDSISTATPKYITIDSEDEKLPYQKMDFSRAKSAMFFPLYIDNVYIGYWIIESSVIHAFDDIDTTLLEVIKDDIVSILKTVSYQTAMESIVRTDQFTGLYSAEYLYGQAKAKIDSEPTSIVAMFRITNIEEINNTYSRIVGNNVIISLSNWAKTCIDANDIFVRYMGPKFVIVYIGKTEEEVVPMIKSLKQDLEDTQVEYINEQTYEQFLVRPKINFAIGNYYKGTGIESVTKKLEEYLDKADKKENNINFI
ncbi:MAG: diguanylate cyclase [Clostridia bacterium]|nr:diguanylate cyclase [Clostridia bacterium]